MAVNATFMICMFFSLQYVCHRVRSQSSTIPGTAPRGYKHHKSIQPHTRIMAIRTTTTNRPRKHQRNICISRAASNTRFYIDQKKTPNSRISNRIRSSEWLTLTVFFLFLCQLKSILLFKW